MKAAVYYENGGPEVFKYEDVPDLQCHPRGIILDVEAVSIEGGDVLNRAGGPLKNRPHVVGYQAAGTVCEVGSEVTERKVGDRVATSAGDGSHAAQRSVPVRASWIVPDNLPLDEAACIPVTFGTADDCLFEFGHLQEGETVLIQGAAGGVGVAAVQLAKRAGATVLATASNQKKLDFLSELGADHCINYTEGDWLTEVRRITDNKGVNLVVDPVGGSVLQNSIRAIAYRGRVVTVGNAGRESMKFDISSIGHQNQSITGVFLGSEQGTPRAYNMIQDRIEDAARGDIKVMIDKRFPLSEAADAHAYIESRQALGRVVLIP
ncbi:MAG: zinc-binding dehydrogenase [Pseudomonadales bacterium]|jgi:NADPH2:quinone reductase|nr:zinc-binding dehydrogenase [Pseudomonadales bacterium]MDP7360430.1 zinc-binding dehydrogenase [Pseudomonadales bacterium]MDP7594185.1 zinc-binding dehydrogenase [Pseudomonadales bacterium]HJN52890.1 zinc-binding dehydrogenase [Pseudomonadales bacterium]|tara:strand:+ start:13970 stop:14932 length:963 start_codon:yes stop_codon:yes gene_type:complete